MYILVVKTMEQLLKKYCSWKHLQQGILALFVMILATGIVATPARAIGVYQMPNSSSDRVLDKAEVLSRFSEGKINGILENLAKTTGNEITMVTIHRLDYGETIESFTKALFEKWFPTPEAQANQTLLVIDTVTNTTAIRTGEAVKNLLPDAIAESVVSETVAVPLRDGNKYNQALLDASDRLIAVLSGQPDPGPPIFEEKVEVASTYKPGEAAKTERGNSTIWVIGLLLAATIIPMATYFFYQGFSG